MVTIDCTTGDGYLTVTENNIIIQSPNYPGNYPSPIDCTALIRYAPYDLVEITIEDFKLTATGACDGSYLRLEDSGNTFVAGARAPYLTYNGFVQFCGLKQNPPGTGLKPYLPPGTKMRATSNLMQIHFYSTLGAHQTNSGFKLVANAGKNSTIIY